jgi:hypothetical protein
MSLPDPTSQQHAVAIPGIKVSDLVFFSLPFFVQTNIIKINLIIQ